MRAKAILPLPNLHTEPNEETRVGPRYLAHLAGDQARAPGRAPAAVTGYLRRHITRDEKLEVET
ncbi:hypothetical protein NS330_10015, partial [Curtobacterium citreum]